MTNSQALVGFNLPVFYDRPELIAAALRFLTGGLKAGQVVSKADEVLPLAAVAEAHRRLESREVARSDCFDSKTEPEGKTP